MTDDDLTTIRVDQYFPHPVEKVWRALTTPALLERWLRPSDFSPTVGHRFTIQANPMPAVGFSGLIACEVLEVSPPLVLRFSWRDADQAAGLDSVVSWTLAGEGHGTRLILEHAGFDPDDPTQQLSRRIMGGGWRSQVMARLGAVLDELA